MKTKKRKIAIDVEDTLADVASCFLKEYNRLRHTNYNLYDVDWEFKNIGSSLNEFIEITKKCWKNFHEIKPTEKGLKEKINRMLKKYEIDILTARQDSISEMRKWLKIQNIPYREFRKTNHYRESKKKILLEEKYYAIIDDNPLLAEDMNNEIGIIIFLYDRPWNRYIKERKNVKRVKSFSDVLHYLGV